MDTIKTVIFVVIGLLVAVSILKIAQRSITNTNFNWKLIGGVMGGVILIIAGWCLWQKASWSWDSNLWKVLLIILSLALLIFLAVKAKWLFQAIIVSGIIMFVLFWIGRGFIWYANQPAYRTVTTRIQIPTMDELAGTEMKAISLKKLNWPSYMDTADHPIIIYVPNGFEDPPTIEELALFLNSGSEWEFPGKLVVLRKDVEVPKIECKGTFYAVSGHETEKATLETTGK